MLKKRTLFWREALSDVKTYKIHLRTTFGSWDVEKVHTVLARSTFRCQNVQNTCSDHLWKLRCWKSARRDGAKHMSKSKCTKHMFGALLEIEMFKKCTLWREANFQVKMHKAPHVPTTFGSYDVVLRGRCKGFGRHSARDMFMRHLVWPGLIFNAWQAQYFRQTEWKTAKRIGTRSSALHSTFHFWRKSHRIA